MKYLKGFLKTALLILAVFAVLCSIPILIELVVLVCAPLILALSISLATADREPLPKTLRISGLVVLSTFYFYQADNLFGWVNLMSEGLGHVVIPFGWPNITFSNEILSKVMWWAGWGGIVIGSLPLVFEFAEDPKPFPEAQPESEK